MIVPVLSDTMLKSLVSIGFFFLLPLSENRKSDELAMPSLFM